MQGDGIPVFNLYRYRTRHHLSTAQVARACGVHQVTYERWERGNHNPHTFLAVCRLAQVLRVSVRVLMQEEAA